MKVKLCTYLLSGAFNSYLKGDQQSILPSTGASLCTVRTHAANMSLIEKHHNSIFFLIWVQSPG